MKFIWKVLIWKVFVFTFLWSHARRLFVTFRLVFNLRIIRHWNSGKVYCIKQYFLKRPCLSDFNFWMCLCSFCGCTYNFPIIQNKLYHDKRISSRNFNVTFFSADFKDGSSRFSWASKKRYLISRFGTFEATRNI